MNKKIDLSKYDDHKVLGAIARYLNANLGILGAFYRTVRCTDNQQQTAL